jgi:hypothetical protein
MRTALRARAFSLDEDGVAREPAVHATAAVELLSAAGVAHRGQVLALS